MFFSKLFQEVLGPACFDEISISLTMAQAAAEYDQQEMADTETAGPIPVQKLEVWPLNAFLPNFAGSRDWRGWCQETDRGGLQYGRSARIHAKKGSPQY